eukprot:210446-Alexandrium_andersonii.AAC.1
MDDWEQRASDGVFWEGVEGFIREHCPHLVPILERPAARIEIQRRTKSGEDIFVGMYGQKIGTLLA